MIRRREGDRFWLVTQHDHARLSAALASQIGGDALATPTQGWHSVLGIALHDCGWPVHDDEPTLNQQGEPSDVFETPPEWALRVWETGAARAEATAPRYAALLVSLHVMSLCDNAVRSPAHSLDNRQKFAVGRFLNDQAARQLRLREKLASTHGLHTDLPLHMGLVMRDGPGGDDPAEQRLIYDFRLLQAMDLLSLCLTRTPMPANRLGPLPGSPGGRNVSINVDRRDGFHFELEPWPFRPENLVFAVPYRDLPAAAFESTDAFRSDYAASAQRRWLFRLSRHPARGP